MGADDQDRLVGPLGEHPGARDRGGLGIAVEGGRPVRVGHLAGMVAHVAGDHRGLAFRLDHHADVAGRMARRGDQPDLRADAVIEIDHLGQARIEDRLDRVGQDRLLLLVALGAPVVELGPAEQVAGVREGRDPLAVLKHGVPTDVVDVKMGADHGVDAFARPAGVGQMLQEGCRERVAAQQAARLVVADARVDHQPQAGRLDQQGVDGEQELVLLIDEVGIEPGRAPQGLGRGEGQEGALRIVGDRHHHLDNAGDLHRAHLPRQHRILARSVGCCRASRSRPDARWTAARAGRLDPDQGALGRAGLA